MLFEVYRGGAYSSPIDRRSGVKRVKDALPWVAHLRSTVPGAGPLPGSRQIFSLLANR